MIAPNNHNYFPVAKEPFSVAEASQLKKPQSSTKRGEKTSSSKHPSGANFVLGPRDLIEISVWESDNMKTEMPIRPDGLISFPLIGDIKAGGLTTEELRKAITIRLKDYFIDATVSVILKEINSDTIRVSIGGEVNGPGSYKVHKPATILHAISIGKGVTENVNLRKSYLLRQGKRVGVDFFALIEGNDLSQNVYLKNNDLIYFPNNFENRINIMGEVQKPQIILFREGMTILDAVLLAGGLTEIAKPAATKVYRKISQNTGNETVKKYQVALDKVIVEGDLTKNMLLNPGDIILVPRSFF